PGEQLLVAAEREGTDRGLGVDEVRLEVLEVDDGGEQAAGDVVLVPRELGEGDDRDDERDPEQRPGDDDRPPEPAGQGPGGAGCGHPADQPRRTNWTAVRSGP